MYPAVHPEATTGPFSCWLKLLASQGALQLGDLPPGPCLTLSLCTDNLWSDQSLETDPDLPPGWRKICDSLGTYYWHVSTGTTQWQHPAHTTCPGGHLEADGEETLQGMDCQAPVAKHLAKNRPIPSPMASLSQRTSLPWQGDDFQHSAEPGSKCFAVRLLGSVEIPEEDLAPGKSSIAVNNCIQQLSNSKGQGSGENQGEGQIVAERAVASSRLPCATTLEPVSTEDLPLQVDILEAVRQSMQTYKALYIGSLPVPRAMGMDVLNKAIEKLTRGPGREHWMPSLIHVSDTAMRVHPAQEDEEAAHIWECQVRYVTFLGVGRDAHTFALIVDTGRCFQCTAFWCEPDAGTISEAVQAACMVSGSRNPPNSPALWDTCGRRRRQGLGTEEGKAEGLSGMPNPGGRQGREGADPSEPHPTPRHTQPPSDATLRPRLVVCGPAVVSPCSSTPRPRPVPRVPTGAVPEVPGGRCTG
ncbi:amyloid-beta A4 precursor protein-binding family B member 3 isoform X5 [Falco rusticolus]|uniref:amyloid-beta A4 precursor protein-binding family B member 3 isoform X5 n=1 Tax=Falco rusticolus TaxID=120794 RepID=UPI00188685D6|nr:amyloid-beta A4 precursor protein-binding family B member 3 isoform X5 [Falco rusticolus]